MTAENALHASVANHNQKAAAEQAKINGQLEFIDARYAEQDELAKAQTETQKVLDKRLALAQRVEKEITEAQKLLAEREAGLLAFLK